LADTESHEDFGLRVNQRPGAERNQVQTIAQANVCVTGIKVSSPCPGGKTLKGSELRKVRS